MMVLLYANGKDAPPITPCLDGLITTLYIYFLITHPG